MALTIYRGGTLKFAIALYDNDGLLIDASTVEKIRARLVHAVTKQEYEKYSTDVEDDYEKVEVVDGRVIVPVQALVSSIMDLGELEIRVDIFQTDTDFTNSVSILPAKGILAHIKDI